MIAILPFVVLGQLAGPAVAPVSWTLAAPKGATAIYTYAEGDIPVVQMTCQPNSGQVEFRVAARKRIAAQKSGKIWTNLVGMPAPWPASIILNSGGMVSTLRGAVDADPVTGASLAVVEASTQAPLFKGFSKTGVMTFTIMGETVAPMAASPGEARKFLRACD